MTEREARKALIGCLLWAMLGMLALMAIGCTSTTKCTCTATAGEGCKAETTCTEGVEIEETPVEKGGRK